MGWATFATPLCRFPTGVPPSSRVCSPPPQGCPQEVPTISLRRGELRDLLDLEISSWQISSQGLPLFGTMFSSQRAQAKTWWTRSWLRWRPHPLLMYLRAVDGQISSLFTVYQFSGHYIRIRRAGIQDSETSQVGVHLNSASFSDWCINDNLCSKQGTMTTILAWYNDSYRFGKYMVVQDRSSTANPLEEVLMPLQPPTQPVESYSFPLPPFPPPPAQYSKPPSFKAFEIKAVVLYKESELQNNVELESRFKEDTLTTLANNLFGQFGDIFELPNAPERQPCFGCIEAWQIDELYGNRGINPLSPDIDYYFKEDFPAIVTYVFYLPDGISNAEETAFKEYVKHSNAQALFSGSSYADKIRDYKYEDAENHDNYFYAESGNMYDLDILENRLAAHLLRYKVAQVGVTVMTRDEKHDLSMAVSRNNHTQLSGLSILFTPKEGDTVQTGIHFKSESFSTWCEGDDLCSSLRTNLLHSPVQLGQSDLCCGNGGMVWSPSSKSVHVQHCIRSKGV
ncbi:hypothetical protein DUNSADRAFT_10566 [Dunaliella salina]|uniref:Uncharacterized protein n=1 Tax=Dunaliella salina TaxID=3046 RepID=A0ABQ7H4S4_DUNSA|nr:hypothetical protein DUNSADRAFT_10566 [Dunaliella salina]|eukprot:KAF5841860.1 hypothetical protein DUNSADRAFT_10566 [Dunaliella salina]